MAGIIIERQTPAQRMAPAEQEVLKSGGKVLIFDGKKDVEVGKPTEPEKPAPETKKVEEAAAAGAEKKDEKKELSGLEALRKSLGFWKEPKKDEKKEDKGEGKAAEAAAGQEAKGGAEAAAGDKGGVDDAGAESERDKKGKFTKKPRSGITPELVETMATTAARAAVEANRASAAPDKPTEADPAADLSPADRRDLEVLSYMAKNDDRYKGLDKQFLKFTKEFGAYQADWEKENPDKQFDPEDSEHDTFYAKHEPKYDRADFDEARISMTLDSRMKERERAMEERYGKIESKLLEQELAPVLDRKAGESIHAMVQAVDPEAAKVLVEKGQEALAEQDPMTFEVLDRTASDMRVLVGELEKLSHPSGRFRFDEKNPAHKFLDEFAAGLEQSIKRMPFEDQVRDGKMFATQAELSGMPAAQRSRFWTIDNSIITEELVKSMSEGAKKVLTEQRNKLDKYAKARGLAPAKATDAAADKSAQGGQKTAAKTNSPAAATDAGNASAGTVQNHAEGAGIRTLVSKLWPS